MSHRPSPPTPLPDAGEGSRPAYDAGEGSHPAHRDKGGEASGSTGFSPSPASGRGALDRRPQPGGQLATGRGVRAARVAVVCESTACLPPELIARYRIGVIPIPFVFGTDTFLDGVDITPAEFYTRLASSQVPPKTSPPSPGEYLQAWQATGAEGVVLVTVDGSVSTLQRSALMARDLAGESLPGVAVAVVDSRSAGMGQGFVALAAARTAADGRSMEEVVRVAEDVSQRVRMIVTLDTLEYLARASRIPQVAAFVGALLSIKPIVQLSGGDIRMLARVRTRRRSIEALFEQVRQGVPAGTRLHAAVQHARADEEAARLADRLRDEFAPVELYTTEFTPVMGGYCGPDLLGVAFYTEEESM